MASERRLGWNPDREDRDYLAAGTKLFTAPAKRLEIPAEFDPRLVLQVEQQEEMGSCTGHMASTAFELDAYWVSGGKARPQHSRMFAYLGAQAESGYLGSDDGASIAGAVESLKTRGVCLEATFPYPHAYTTRIPKAATEEALKYRIKNHSPLRSYDLVWQWLTSGFGGVCIGITWTTACDACTGIFTPELMRKGRVRGGHALCFCGWSKRKDASGRNYIWLANSHGSGWGFNGFAECHPDMVDAVSEGRNYECSGITGASSYDVPRKIVGDWGRVVAG